MRAEADVEVNNKTPQLYYHTSTQLYYHKSNTSTKL